MQWKWDQVLHLSSMVYIIPAILDSIHFNENKCMAYIKYIEYEWKSSIHFSPRNFSRSQVIAILNLNIFIAFRQLWFRLGGMKRVCRKKVIQALVSNSKTPSAMTKEIPGKSQSWWPANWNWTQYLPNEKNVLSSTLQDYTCSVVIEC